MKRSLLLFTFLLVINSLHFAQFNQWVDAGNMLSVREDHTATLLQNGRVLIVGWESNVAELYDPATDNFTPTGSTIKNHRQGLTATLLNDGKVLIAGGVNAQNTAELYDPLTGNFQLIDTLNNVHCYHTATLLNDGRVVIAGGQNNFGPQTHAVCEIYDPLTNKFTLTIDSLNDHRSGHRAVLLQDGKVLIIGGIQTTTPGSGIYLNTCEIYDPASDTFILTQNLNQPRAGHQATLLKDGKVLVTCGAYYQKYGEIYNPVTGIWAPTGEMSTARRGYHTATMLHDGKVLIAGGYADLPITSAEIFNPVTNSFNIIDSMKTPRSSYCAIKLNDGSVLVTGGYNGTMVVNSAERYLVDTSEVVSVREVNNSQGKIPHEYQLLQNYPNPFNPNTKIRYAIPRLRGDKRGGLVTLKVYDVLGNEIAVLVNEYKPAGVYEVVFDAYILPSGLYFYKLQSGSFTETKKMILLR